MSMASSNNSNSVIKKTKKREPSTPASKPRKEENKKTNNNNNNNNKKKKLEFSKGNSKQVAKGKKQKHLKEDGNGVDGGEEAKAHVFPMNRIRTMLKGEIPDIRVSSEAILAINKAAEKFIEQFTQDAYVCAVQDRKKSLTYDHLSHVVSKKRRYDFLSDFVPEKVKAVDALRERNSIGNRRG